MRTYQIAIEGAMPLIMHQDNIEWASRMKRWRETPANKKVSVAGDDRSPAHTWLGALYHDDEHVAIPADNLMRCFMGGGAMVPVPSGKNGKTFKAQTQSGMLIPDQFWPLLVGGKPIAVKSIMALLDEDDFEVHEATAQKLGFTLFVKRAKIGTSKHVRVRPRFDRWAATGTLNVLDDQLTLAALRDIIKQAGAYHGLGDWRPSSKTPGPFGRFSATVSEMK